VAVDSATHGPDSNVSYYRDDSANAWLFQRYPLSGRLLKFQDAPSMPSAVLDFGLFEYIHFQTEFVGVDGAGNVVRAFGDAPNGRFVWKSDQEDFGAEGGVHLGVLPDDSRLRPIVGGGIFDIQAVLHGDTNFDAQVDITDLNNVRNNFGGYGLGDANGDHYVGIDDLNAVRNNFGATIAAPSPVRLIDSLSASPDASPLAEQFAKSRARQDAVDRIHEAEAVAWQRWQDATGTPPADSVFMSHRKSRRLFTI
jgi:hypothetical protein